MITYTATLDVPREMAWHLATLLRADQRKRGTRKGRRALTVFWHAVLVLRWFRDGTRVAQLATDAGIGIATAYRYLHQALDALAAQAPELPDALQTCLQSGLTYVILDGKLVPTDRVAERAEAGQHRGGIPASTMPSAATSNSWPPPTDGRYGSPRYAGSMVDLPAARTQGLGALLHAAAQGLPTLADKGYQAAGIGIHTPIKNYPHDGNRLDADNRCYNTLLTRLRCRGERAMALLTQRWKALHRITLCPRRIGTILQAALVLTHTEHHKTH